VVWQDLRDPKINVFAQHVLASGELDLRWPLDGRALLGDPAALAAALPAQLSGLAKVARIAQCDALRALHAKRANYSAAIG
jgi:hypothetical protein